MALVAIVRLVAVVTLIHVGLGFLVRQSSCRFVQIIARHDDYGARVMKKRHDIEANVFLRVWNNPHYRCHSFCITEIHDLLHIKSASWVHGFQLSEICQHSKPRSHIRQECFHLFKTVTDFPDSYVAGINHSQ